MTRSNSGIFSRSNEYERDTAALPNWLTQFANNYEASQKSAVEVARQRDQDATVSIYDRMSAMINGGGSTPKLSPYATVDEAVQDYHKRTGLMEYRKLAMAQEIMKAADEIDCSSEEKKTSEKPEFLVKNPAIDSFINNIIDTQYGIQVPAVLQSVIETFSRHVSENDINDSDLARYINNIICTKRPEADINNVNIGRGVGTERAQYEYLDGNRDPFMGLVPQRF